MSIWSEWFHHQQVCLKMNKVRQYLICNVRSQCFHNAARTLGVVNKDNPDNHSCQLEVHHSVLRNRQETVAGKTLSCKIFNPWWITRRLRVSKLFPTRIYCQTLGCPHWQLWGHICTEDVILISFHTQRACCQELEWERLCEHHIHLCRQNIGAQTLRRSHLSAMQTYVVQLLLLGAKSTFDIFIIRWYHSPSLLNHTEILHGRKTSLTATILFRNWFFQTQRTFTF